MREEITLVSSLVNIWYYLGSIFGVTKSYENWMTSFDPWHDLCSKVCPVVQKWILDWLWLSVTSRVCGKRIFMTSINGKYYWLSKIWQNHFYIGFEHEKTKSTGESWKMDPSTQNMNLEQWSTQWKWTVQTMKLDAFPDAELLTVIPDSLAYIFEWYSLYNQSL